ncbi:hypothetical protein [Herbaspirillum sp. NPDC087042]|uniref:hypothetical protein n=1 Tax=Herbaspirillum sp. NPDC087042 TaxID=3364004 RepID=UPI0037F2C087
MTAEIELWFYARPDRTRSIDERHGEVMSRLAKIDGPFGFSGLDLPEAPDCGDGLVAVYSTKLPTRGLKFIGDYAFRGAGYRYEDRASYDEHIRYQFKVTNKEIDYRRLLYLDFPKLVEAFAGYKAKLSYDIYSLYYQGGTNDENIVYNKLRENKELNVDGRNNIFTLYPSQFWDAELCVRALGYGPEEVIARLKGVCPMAIPLLDGVYMVLNDDPKITYEAYVEMNNTIKPVLGLI